MNRRTAFFLLALAGLFAGVLLLGLLGQRPASSSPSAASGAQKSQAPQASLASRSGAGTALRPLAPVSASAAHEWTGEDATAPETIAKIAHNRSEFVRLVQENARIQRRQLVYRKEPAWVLVERAKGEGKPLAKLVLPGLDGREVVMEIESSDLALSGLSGTFAGRVAGRQQSLVTLAFDRGREAFTVVSPEDGIYLQGDPREPGEIIVASFDPQKYQPLPCGNPATASR